MKFSITNTCVYGLEKSFKASGNPMRTKIETGEVNESDFRRSVNLASTKGGEGHDNFLKGIVVQMDLCAPLYFWKQAQRYHWFDFVSSQSTMHCLLKFDVREQCVPDTNEEIINILERLVREYLDFDEQDSRKKSKWRELVASLPCGFCLTASMTTNYQQLKTMYFQRRHHKLSEWQEFAKWCESLPHFTDLLKL